MSPVTTHVLDTAAGRPAAGVQVRLERRDEEGWTTVGSGTTDAGGRASALVPGGQPLAAGRYRLTFELEAYFASDGRSAFFPRATVEFRLEDPGQHYHVPLLVSPFGYTTYRGS